MAEAIQKADKQKDKATKKNADEKGKTENRPSIFDPPQLREVKKKLSMKDLEVITRINTRARARARTRAHAPVNRNRIPLRRLATPPPTITPSAVRDRIMTRVSDTLLQIPSLTA